MKKIIILIITFLLFVSCFATEIENPIITEALTHLDKPYIYGTEGPSSFDCTGFTYYVYKQTFDIILKRSAYDQGHDDTYEKIEMIDELIPGDLIYFNTNHYDNDLSDHAGIYLGNNEFIHCSSAKGRVIISSLSDGFYNKNFSWGRRILIGGKENEHDDKTGLSR